MANLALALTFVLAWFTNGALLLRGPLARYVSEALSTSQCFLVLALVNYWIPAVLIYILLRSVCAERWLSSCRGIQFLLGLGNLLVILLGLSIVYALTFKRPGSDGLVYLGAAVFALPAMASYLAAFVWLLYRSLSGKEKMAAGWGAFHGDGIVVTVSLMVPLLIVAGLMFISRDVPTNLANEAQKVFADKCQEAGEVIVERAKGVSGIYLDPDSGSYFEKNGKGSYKAVAYGEVGQPLVDQGLLQFYEKKNAQKGGGSVAEYRKHTLENLKGEPIEEISSQYGVFHKRLTTDYEEDRLKIHGEEVTIMNLETGKVIATQRYFTNREGEMCGSSKGGDPSVDDFIQRTLHLTKRFQGSQRFSRSR